MTDRQWDRRLNVRTEGREDERGHKYMPYEPTPYPVLARLADAGWLGPEDHLLDFGCGKGRAVFFLADQTGCRATGIDHSPRLIAQAEENRAGFAGADRVRFVCMRAEACALEDATALFFFNPFSEQVLRVALRRLRGQWLAAPRPLKLAFYYPSRAYAEALAGEDWLCPAGQIDCRDLFDGDDPRECLALYRAAPRIFPVSVY